MAFIRAFFDDSGSETGDRRLFMAGYINRAESWALFSEAWDEELRAASPKSIEHLKTGDAYQLQNQFCRQGGWNEEKRDEKLRGLARVIRHFQPISFQISIDREFFYRTNVSSRGLANPYFDCCTATVAAVANFGAQAKFQHPIEFIFDQQDGVESDITMLFAQIRANFPKRTQRMIHGSPQFVDDKHFRPLQAADLLVGHIRREHEYGVKLPLTEKLIGEYHLVTEIPNSLVQRWADHNKRQPGIENLQTKSQWRGFKANFAKQVAAGADPSTLGKPPLRRRIISKIKRLFS